MKKMYLLVALVGLVSCSDKTQESNLLSPQDFQNRFTPDVTLIDVRTPEEFTTGNLPNSLNLDFRNPEFMKNISLLDKNRTYLIYCASGVRSGQALEKMQKEGFKNVFALKGGLKSWQEEGMPMN
jgi:thioredoxin 1